MYPTLVLMTPDTEEKVSSGLQNHPSANTAVSVTDDDDVAVSAADEVLAVSLDAALHRGLGRAEDGALATGRREVARAGRDAPSRGTATLGATAAIEECRSGGKISILSPRQLSD